MQKCLAVVTLPDFYNADRLAAVWPVPYQKRSTQAQQLSQQYQIQPAHTDNWRICLLLIDIQNIFCLPEFELFVAGAI